MDHQSPLLKQVPQVESPKTALKSGLRILACALITGGLLVTSAARADSSNLPKPAGNSSTPPGNSVTGPAKTQSGSNNQLNTGPQAQPKPTIQSIPTIQRREPTSPRP